MKLERTKFFWMSISNDKVNNLTVSMSCIHGFNYNTNLDIGIQNINKNIKKYMISFCFNCLIDTQWHCRFIFSFFPHKILRINVSVWHKDSIYRQSHKYSKYIPISVNLRKIVFPQLQKYLLSILVQIRHE